MNKKCEQFPILTDRETERVLESFHLYVDAYPNVPLDARDHYVLAPSSFSPEHDSAVLLGIHYIRGARHTDTARANALGLLYDLDVFGASELSEKDPHHIDVRFSSRGMRKVFQTVINSTGKSPSLMMMDYFWLENTYLSRKHAGYGGDWISTFADMFFRDGGRVFIMPMDRWGQVLRSLSEDYPGHRHLYNYELMSLDKTYQHHPLWISTEAASKSAAWFTDVGKDTHKTNMGAYAQFLNHETPFLMMYTNAYKSSEDAYAYLDSLKSDFFEKRNDLPKN
jgi:hypothetical protein